MHPAIVRGPNIFGAGRGVQITEVVGLDLVADAALPARSPACCGDAAGPRCAAGLYRSGCRGAAGPPHVAMLASFCLAAAPKAEIADARVRGVMPGRVYSASKHAVIGLTKGVAA